MSWRRAGAAALIAVSPAGAESVPGRLQWPEPLAISTPRSGRVTDVLVSPGERVAAGQSLKVRVAGRELSAVLVDPGLAPDDGSGAPQPIALRLPRAEDASGWGPGEPVEILLP